VLQSESLKLLKKKVNKSLKEAQSPEALAAQLTAITLDAAEKMDPEIIRSTLIGLVDPQSPDSGILQLTTALNNAVGGDTAAWQDPAVEELVNRLLDEEPWCQDNGGPVDCNKLAADNNSQGRF
jgi:hypothetical protein